MISIVTSTKKRIRTDALFQRRAICEQLDMTRDRLRERLVAALDEQSNAFLLELDVLAFLTSNGCVVGVSHSKKGINYDTHECTCPWGAP